MPVGQRTKSPVGGTARRILEHARAAFNERGVGNVGVRDIARELDLSPGNLSYHFPTKDELVIALVEEMHAQNTAVVAAPLVGPFDFAQLDAVIRNIMRRDLENAWLYRDLVSLLYGVPGMRAIHGSMQRAREARVDTLVGRLIDARLLERKTTERALPQLRLQLLTQILFWVPSAIIHAPERNPAARLDLHARSVMALFLVHCTPNGRRRLAPFIASAP